jgi:predicted DNA-binding protein
LPSPGSRKAAAAEGRNVSIGGKAVGNTIVPATATRSADDAARTMRRREIAARDVFISRYHGICIAEQAMISVALNPDTEQRLTELAVSRGLSEGDFARELIEACIEDLEDIQMAAVRLENRQPALTVEQARKALGLED